MATRGVYIMDGYIPNRGMFRVYQDLDNPNFFFCDAKKYDLSMYVARERVQPRGKKSHSRVNADFTEISCSNTVSNSPSNSRESEATVVDAPSTPSAAKTAGNIHKAAATYEAPTLF